jgi:hypothetical protein
MLIFHHINIHNSHASSTVARATLEIVVALIKAHVPLKAVTATAATATSGEKKEEEKKDETKIHYSKVECLLYIFHQLASKVFICMLL